MERIVRLSSQERRDLFAETAARRSTTPAVIEKDFWVTRTLARLFQDERLAQVLMFKGGTSLSKVYRVIERFSEDIDLVLDWNVLTEEDPLAVRSSNQQARFNKKMLENAQRYISDDLFGQIQTALGDIVQCVIDDKDPYVVNINYPAAFPDTYLRPEIRLEIGPLASWSPHEDHLIRSYAAEEFPGVFQQAAACQVRVIGAERTFWEKVTILHHEAHRPINSPQPSRYSRHYYDLASLALTEVKEKALRNTALLDSVVAFKQKFYPRAWAKYELARPGTLKLMPTNQLLASVKDDYRAMANMIFGHKPPFSDVMLTLEKLEAEINGLSKIGDRGLQ